MQVQPPMMRAAFCILHPVNYVHVLFASQDKPFIQATPCDGSLPVSFLHVGLEQVGRIVPGDLRRGRHLDLVDGGE